MSARRPPAWHCDKQEGALVAVVDLNIVRDFSFLLSGLGLVWLVGFLKSSSTTRLYRGRSFGARKSRLSRFYSAPFQRSLHLLLRQQSSSARCILTLRAASARWLSPSPFPASLSCCSTWTRIVVLRDVNGLKKKKKRKSTTRQ